MLALALFSMAANALTVFYNNTASNWTKVCAYTFSEETLGKWPGTEMTAVADHAGWFSVEVDETKATKIIFNNGVGGGTAQTGDLTLNAAKPYYNDGWTSSFDGEVIVEIYTIYYNNVKNWDKVYAYGWGGAAVTAGWPGNEMTAVADHAGWFSIDFKGGVPANIIFNNNSGDQTGDLTVDPDNLYYNNGWVNNFEGEIVITNDFYLVGWINNADYTGDDYKFVDGKLTARFDADSYVGVRNGATTYFTEAYVDFATSATATLKAGNKEKMGIYGGKDVEFTLVVNEDKTLTLSYQIDDIHSAVENVAAGYALTLDNGCLSVATDKVASVALYTIGGQLLDMQFTSDYRCTLNAGIYILRVDNTAEKLVVF